MSELTTRGRFRAWAWMAFWIRGRNAVRRVVRWLVRLLLRVGLLPASTRAETDTMGEWKRLMAEKDDPKPGLVLPDPNTPHAALIRRVRLYAKNGAKALAPLLDQPVPERTNDGPSNVYYDAWAERIAATLNACEHDTEARAIIRSDELSDERSWNYDALAAIHAAYNSPWTVVDGEVYEYESERKRRVVQ